VTVTPHLSLRAIDDCLSRTFRDGHAAFEFACDCAEAIDANDWADCVINNDGRVRDAFADWNEKQRFDNQTGLMGNAVITVSTEFDRRAMLAYCRGDDDWHKQKDNTDEG
jgi:hypothetical protein